MQGRAGDRDRKRKGKTAAAEGAPNISLGRMWLLRTENPDSPGAICGFDEMANDYADSGNSEAIDDAFREIAALHGIDMARDYLEDLMAVCEMVEDPASGAITTLLFLTVTWDSGCAPDPAQAAEAATAYSLTAAANAVFKPIWFTLDAVAGLSGVGVRRTLEDMAFEGPLTCIVPASDHETAESGIFVMIGCETFKSGIEGTVSTDSRIEFFPTWRVGFEKKFPGARIIDAPAPPSMSDCGQVSDDRTGVFLPPMLAEEVTGFISMAAEESGKKEIFLSVSASIKYCSLVLTLADGTFVDDKHIPIGDGITAESLQAVATRLVRLRADDGNDMRPIADQVEKPSTEGTKGRIGLTLISGGLN